MKFKSTIRPTILSFVFMLAVTVVVYYLSIYLNHKYNVQPYITWLVTSAVIAIIDWKYALPFFVSAIVEFFYPNKTVLVAVGIEIVELVIFAVLTLLKTYEVRQGSIIVSSPLKQQLYTIVR